MSQSPPPSAAALFGSVAAGYANHRPTYPEGFFSAFLERLPLQAGAQGLVWDCGCGSGQASLALARRGLEVIATDASAEQLAAAPCHPCVTYRQATAEASGLQDQSVDGVLVASAVHWFGGEAFNAEVRRVCRPGAVMAWIGYRTIELELAPLHEQVRRFYDHTLAPWWPPQRALVERAYAGLPFPGQEWAFPAGLEIRRHWALPELLGYLGSWSAVAAARAAGHDPLPALAADLEQLWPGGGATAVAVRWPVMGRWGRVH